MYPVLESISLSGSITLLPVVVTQGEVMRHQSLLECVDIAVVPIVDLIFGLVRGLAAESGSTTAFHHILET